MTLGKPFHLKCVQACSKPCAPCSVVGQRAMLKRLQICPLCVNDLPDSVIVELRPVDFQGAKKTSPRGRFEDGRSEIAGSQAGFRSLWLRERRWRDRGSSS